MMINEEEFNSNESVRNYYKSNLSNEYKKLKASLFLGEKISDEYIFSLIINAAYLDDTHVSSRAHFLLSKPLKDQHILFLIEYFRVVINKDYEDDRSLAPKLLKILMRKGYKSLLIKLILDSNNKKLRDFLLEKVEAHKSTSDREQLFLIYELWKSKVISRNEADRRLELFINNYKARQTFLSKPFSRKQAMAFMLVSIIYLQMNLVKKGNSLFAQIAANGVWTEKVVRTWYDGIEETYEKEIYDNDRRLVKTGAYFRTITFNSKFPEICEQFKENLKTDFQELISQPINYSQLICNGLKTTNLIVYANETLNHTRNLQISESAFNLYTLINKSTGHIYDHKALLSYIPALKTLNNEFAESKTTKKFNKYFMSKNNYYHSALFLLLPKEAFKDNGLDFNQLEEKFIKAFLRYRFYSGYSKGYLEDGYRFYGSPKKITVIYKYIYLYGDSKMRAWLEDLAILKTLVSSSHGEIEELTSASTEQLKGFSLALNYHHNEIGDKYFENINTKIDSLYKSNSFEQKFRSKFRDLLDSMLVDEITALVKKAYENKNDNEIALALKVLSLLNFNKKDRSSKLNRYLSDKNFIKYLELFCAYMYKAIQNDASVKKLRIPHSYGMLMKPLNLINKLIFFYCSDKVYATTIKKDNSDSVLLHLKAINILWGSVSELALKRYQKLKEIHKKKSKKLVRDDFSECIKDIYFDNNSFRNKKFKKVVNNILFGSLIENFNESQVKKILEDYHAPRKMDQNKFIKFITFLNEDFLHKENYFGRKYDETTLEEEYRSSLEKIINELISDYAKVYDIQESKLQKLFLDNQYHSLSYDEHEKEFNDLALLFNNNPKKYFFELWDDRHYRLFMERAPRVLNPIIDKEKFYNQLDKEIKKLTSISVLNDSQLSLLSGVLKILSDVKDKSYWVDVDKKTIAVINKHKSTLFDYLMKKINLKTSGLKSLEFFKLISSNTNLFILRKAYLESFLISVIKNKSFNYDQKYKFLLEIYNDRSALKLFGKASYQNLIDSFIESLKSQIKYKKTSTILKHRFSSIDELAKVQILKIHRSKMRLTYLQKRIINLRIQDLKFSRENCSFCKENNFDYWGLHLNIYG